MEVFLVCIGASFIQRTTGFGFGIFIMTLLPFLLPSYGEATAVSGLLAMLTSLVVVVKMRQYIVWRRLLSILAAFVVVSTGAIFLLSKAEGEWLWRVLGCVLVATSLYFFFFNHRIWLKDTPAVRFTAGALSGMMGGFFGMQGPPAVLYFISSEKDKEHYMAMTQCYLLAGNLLMTVVRGMNGFLTSAVGTAFLYGVGGVAIGAGVGAYVFDRIPGQWFRYIVYLYVGISGVVILCRY